MTTSLDRVYQELFGVDMCTSDLIERHGSICGCPEFWDSITALNDNVSVSTSPSDDTLPSGCPHADVSFHRFHSHSAETVPKEEVTSSAAPSTSTYTSQPHPMASEEPRGGPSREIKETCIFWYHGHCARGTGCRFEHGLNHNWPVALPPAYMHRRRCELKFCPLRTDLVEFMQHWYPGGPRESEGMEEMDPEPEQQRYTTGALSSKVAEFQHGAAPRTEIGEGSAGMDLDHSSDMGDDGISDETWADSAIPPTSITPSFISLVDTRGLAPGGPGRGNRRPEMPRE